MINILDELIERLYKAITDADLEMTENTLTELEELGVGWQEAMDMVNEIGMKSMKIIFTNHKTGEKNSEFISRGYLEDPFKSTEMEDLFNVHV